MKVKFSETGIIVLIIISFFLVASLSGKTDSWKEITIATVGGYFGYLTNSFKKDSEK